MGPGHSSFSLGSREVDTEEVTDQKGCIASLKKVSVNCQKGKHNERTCGGGSGGGGGGGRL